MSLDRHRASPTALLTRGGREALLACGLTEQDLRAADHLLDSTQDGFWGAPLGAVRIQEAAQILAARAGNPRLGLSVPPHIPEGSLGIVEYIMRSSPSLRHAGFVAERFSRLVADYVRAELVDQHGVATRRFIAPEGLELSPVIVDYRLARWLCVVRSLLRAPELAPHAVHFPYARPKQLEAYAAAFGNKAQLVFDADVPEIVFPAEWLDRPLPGADPLLCQILLEHAEEALAKLPPYDSLGGRIQQELAATLHERRPSLAETARRLRLSERTLRRRLASEGTSFGELLETVRASLVVIYMRSGDASSAYLAERLGFESEGTFRRAYRRWKTRGLIADGSARLEAAS